MIEPGLHDTVPQGDPPTIHASAALLQGSGILVRGPSGAGKSRLVLALLVAEGCAVHAQAGPQTDAASALIGDDRLVLRTQGSALVAHPAPSLAGRIEVRGLAIAGLAWRAGPLRLVVDLMAMEVMERMPDARSVQLAGHALAWLGVPVGDLAHQCLLVRTALALLDASDGPFPKR